MIRNIPFAVSLLSVCALTAGCSQQSTIPVAEFGETVRRVLNSQINDYEAAMHPSPDAVEGSDPYRLDAALNVYRGHVSEAEDIQQPISINVGN